MSILIKGMEMPTRCGECKAFVCYKQLAGDRGDCFCGITKSDCKAGAQNADCPLVPVPAHGDLIERNELLMHRFAGVVGETEMYMIGWNTALEAAAENAPIIIPAEESET